MQSTFLVTLLLGLSSLHHHAPSGEMLTAAEGKEMKAPSAQVKEAKREQPMKMNAPMPTGMAKQGMKKGDVKKAAEKKEKKMQEMMNEEMK